jgi:hypothetical protein
MGLKSIRDEEQLIDGDNNGGVSGKLYVIFKDDVVKTTAASKRKINVKTEVKPGAYCVDWDCIMDPGEIKDALAGETGGKTLESSVSVTIIGRRALTLEQLDTVKNRKCVIFAIDNNGIKWQFGDELFEATLSEGGAGTGKGTAGLNSVNMTFKSIRCYEYTADIPTLGNGLQSVVFGAATSTLGTKTITLPWTNNAGSGNALAGDVLFAEARNQRTGEVIATNGTILRSAGTFNFVFVGMLAGDKINVSAYFRNAGNTLVSSIQYLPQVTVA